MDTARFAIRLSDKGMRVLRFPLVRLFLALVIFIAFSGLAVAVGSWLTDPDAASQPLAGQLIRAMLLCVASVFAYWIYCVTVEGRSLIELRADKAPAQLGIGILLGFGFISAVILVMWMAGGYRVVGTNPVSLLWPVLVMSLQAGIVEEIVTRGIIFRIVEEAVGTWWSVAFSALLFGFMHAWNPNASLFSSVSIALTAGVVLALLFVLTRQLWIPIGLHTGWNLTLGGLYGAPVSGGEASGILQASFKGPEWLTGGSFGPEASVITIGVFLLFIAYLISRILREKRWVVPMWRKRNG